MKIQNGDNKPNSNNNSKLEGEFRGTAIAHIKSSSTRMGVSHILGRIKKISIQWRQQTKIQALTKTIRPGRLQIIPSRTIQLTHELSSSELTFFLIFLNQNNLHGNQKDLFFKPSKILMCQFIVWKLK